MCTRLLLTTWLITKTTAETLVLDIEAQQKIPSEYNVLGNRSVLALSSAKSKSNFIGHNCFTFAKMMLLNLKYAFIQMPEDRIETWICSATSRFLVDNQTKKQ